MKKLLLVMVGGFAVCVAGAQETGYWRASNTPARSITGDLGLGSDKISINFATFTIAEIRELKAGELSSVFDVDAATAAPGKLYRTSIPGSKVLLHKNRLCGSDDAQWMVTDVVGRELHVAFFSGEKMPVFTPEAVNNNSELCGTFVYSR